LSSPSSTITRTVPPWRALERERGVTIRSVPMVPGTGQLRLTAFEHALGPRTRRVAVGAARTPWAPPDVARAAELARAAGAPDFVDRRPHTPHQLVDVRVLQCDFLACSRTSSMGRTSGFSYGRKDRLERLPGAQARPGSRDRSGAEETGTQNHEGIAGSAAAVWSFWARWPRGWRAGGSAPRARDRRRPSEPKNSHRRRRARDSLVILVPVFHPSRNGLGSRVEAWAPAAVRADPSAQ